MKLFRLKRPTRKGVIKGIIIGVAAILLSIPLNLIFLATYDFPILGIKIRDTLITRLYLCPGYWIYQTSVSMSGPTDVVFFWEYQKIGPK